MQPIKFGAPVGGVNIRLDFKRHLHHTRNATYSIDICSDNTFSFVGVSMSINGVVLDADRNPLPLNSLEKVAITIYPAELSVTTGVGFPGASNSFMARGRLTATNYRLVFTSEPPLPLFDSFMVTWNKIDELRLRGPSLWGKLLFSSTPSIRARVTPLEDEEYLRGIATLSIKIDDTEKASNLYDIMCASKWTGHLDPENTLEPPPQYFPPSIATPPPTYEAACEENAMAPTSMNKTGGDV